MLAEHGLHTAFALVHTSVDDCRASLPHTNEPSIIFEALRLANESPTSQKSRIKLLEAKLKQLRK
ncbi:hypothetical protein [Verrucomicrobium spinosum]|uniref:hypothetical protein n=1 Tax=Verrucomicrobium spinosum TaxID=2736 RepID=UPI000A7211F7|nr:hypothetical protein [Verrucomicrobium spinosum]